MQNWQPDPTTSLAIALAAVANRHPDLPLTHRVKCDPEPFEEVWRGRKTGEIRVNDRNYQIGDRLELVEHSYTGGVFCPTGREFYCTISHVLKGYGLPDTHVMLSMQPSGRTWDARDEQAVHEALRIQYNKAQENKNRAPEPHPSRNQNNDRTPLA
jgi:hypothetical protein